MQKAMTRIYRLCPACAQEVALESPRCPHCDCDTQADYWPAPQISALQKLRAVLPAALAIGVVTLQVGLALARNPLVQGMWQLATRNQGKRISGREVQKRGRRGTRVHIRTRWSVEGPDGQLEQGQKESIIESS